MSREWKDSMVNTNIFMFTTTVAPATASDPGERNLPHPGRKPSRAKDSSLISSPDRRGASAASQLAQIRHAIRTRSPSPLIQKVGIESITAINFEIFSQILRPDQKS
jgi:hypothetical protein